MAQETTGAGRAESKDPGMSGSDMTGMTEEERDQVASKLVDRFSLWSGAAGLIPIPSRCYAAFPKFTAFHFPKIEANRS